MGVYVETPVRFGKADWLVEHQDAKRVEPVPPLELDPEHVLLCVADYSPSHEAVGYLFDDAEFHAFAQVPVRTEWLLIEREKALALVSASDRLMLEERDAGG